MAHRIIVQLLGLALIPFIHMAEGKPGFRYGVPIAVVLSLIAFVLIIPVAVIMVIRSKKRRSFKISSWKVANAAENINMDSGCYAGPTAIDYSGPGCNGPDCYGPDAPNVYCDIDDKLRAPRPTLSGAKSVSGDEYAAVDKPNQKRGECATVKNQNHLNIPNASTEFADDCMIENQLYESQQWDVSSDPTKSGGARAYPDPSHFDPDELSLTDNHLYSV